MLLRHYEAFRARVGARIGFEAVGARVGARKGLQDSRFQMELDALDTNYTNYMHVTSRRYFLEHTVLKPYTPEALGAKTGLSWF